MSLLTLIYQHCNQALQQLLNTTNIKIPDNMLVVTEATQKKFGHYQCNSAMKLAKILQIPPLEIATKLQQQLIANDTATPKLFAEVSIVPPGFLNMHLNPKYIEMQINIQLRDPNQGIAKNPTPQKVVLDFSSPNIAKEMHVGHLRSTIIGDSLAKILTFLGHDVLRLNHVGDWGTQFGMLIAYLKTHYQQPEQIALDLPALSRCYQAAKAQFDNDPDFKTMAQQEVVALQSGETYATAIWQQICLISRTAYQEIYDLLDIKIIERGESFYNTLLPTIVQHLVDQNLLVTSDGAKCVYVDGMINREGEPLPLIVQKSDGGYNYATTDLAAIYQRTQVEQASWLIYVIDAGQSQHLQMVFATAKKAKLCATNVKLDHVQFGLVLRGDGKKFKTRSGDTEKLIDLLQTAIVRAGELLIDRTPELTTTARAELAKALGINAVKYADLSNNRLSNYMFSYDKMLQFEGNTAAFLAYACVRIHSIKRKTSANIAELLINTKIILTEAAEIELALVLCKFADYLNLAANELLPNRLTDYLFNLAETFHGFFHHCKVLNAPEQNSRVLLCEATLQVLERGFELLGLSKITKM